MGFVLFVWRFLSFSHQEIHSVAIRDYMERILKLTKCEPGSIVLAVIYMLRICRDHSIPLTSLCFHRLFITRLVLRILPSIFPHENCSSYSPLPTYLSVCVSMKYFEDDVYSNKYMAKVGGISTREVFYLSLSFSLASVIHWNFFC